MIVDQKHGEIKLEGVFYRVPYGEFKEAYKGTRREPFSEIERIEKNEEGERAYVPIRGAEEVRRLSEDLIKLVGIVCTPPNS